MKDPADDGSSADPEEEKLDDMLRRAFGPESTIIPADEIPKRIRSSGQAWSQVLLREPEGEDPVPLPGGRGETEWTDELAGRYQVFGEIARGGIGIVLRGRDRVLGRDIAIKLLRPEHRASGPTQERFFEEAQIGAQLQHPGIVPVHEIGMIEDDQPFFTMKLVRGRTLAEMLRERQDPRTDRGEFLEIFGHVVTTVAYAHARGVIHRDLKPSNIMIGRFGEVQVMDWGLCKVIPRGGIADEPRSPARQHPESLPVETVRTEEPGSNSRVGSVFGTPSYMSPEQARGQVDLIDERTDVFALGAILCEILTGEPPYPPSPQVLQQARDAALTPAFMRLDTVEVDPQIRELAKVSLSVDLLHRPRNAEQLDERLRTRTRELTMQAEQAKLDVQTQRIRATAARRTQRLTLALATCIVLLVVGGSIWVIVWNEGESARLNAISTQARDHLNRARTWIAKAGGQDPRSAQSSFQAASAELDKAQRLSRQASATSAEKLEPEISTLITQVETSQALTSRLARQQSLAKRLLEVHVPPPDQEGSWVPPAARRANMLRQCDGFREAFMENGLPLEETPLEAMLQELRGQDEPFFAFIFDVWAYFETELASPQRTSFHEKVALLARELEHDSPLRKRLRSIQETPGGPDQANQLENLAKGLDLSKESEWDLLFMGQTLWEYDVHLAIRFLERCHLWHPTNYMIAFHLGRFCTNLQDYYERGMCYFRTAYALQPDSIAFFCLGHSLISRNQWDEVRNLAEASIARHPEAYEARRLLFLYHLRRGSVREARQSLEAASRLSPGNPTLDLDAAELAEKEAPLSPDTLMAFEKALTSNPQSSRCHARLAMLHSCQDPPNLLRIYYHSIQAILQDPLDKANDQDIYIGALLNLGESSHFLRSRESAMEALARARALSPSHPVFPVAIARTQLDHGDTLSAEGNLLQALKAAPRDLLARRILGDLYVIVGDVEQAQRQYDLINQDTGHPNATNINLLAIAEHLKGNYAESLALLELAHSLRDRVDHVRLANVTLLASRCNDGNAAGIEQDLRAGARRTAHQALTRVVRGWSRYNETHPEDRPSSRVRLDAVLGTPSIKRSLSDGFFPDVSAQERDDWARMREEFSALREALYDPAGPDRSSAEHWKLGLSFRSEGRHFEAIEEFHYARHLDPANAEYHRELGESYLAILQPTEAITFLEASAKLDPEDLRTSTLASQALFHLGRLVEARSRLEQLLTLDDRNSEATRLLALTLASLSSTEAGLLDEAVRLGMRATTLAPNDPLAWESLAFALYASARKEDALSAAERASDLLQPPRNGGALLIRSILMAEDGRPGNLLAQSRSFIALRHIDPMLVKLVADAEKLIEKR
ncbi:MAG: protein kinase [Planctomycetes bacterium]|nr:protein kinase [Planctomycetota bacterium]